MYRTIKETTTLIICNVLFIFRSSSTFTIIVDEGGVLMNHVWSKRLIRFSAIFGVIGAILGAHMAGAGSLAFRPVHAHILVVGWLSLFAWGIYYQAFRVKITTLVSVQGWTGIIGAAGLSIGLWLRYVMPFGYNNAIILPIYIGGGVILLISFVLFLIVSFTSQEDV